MYFRFVPLNNPLSGYEAGPLALQLSQHTPIPIPYKAPIDWARWATFAGGLLGFLSLIRFIAPILQNKWVWAIGTILTSLVMTSGYMFTQIRGVPYTGPNGQWIASGYQNMYGQEVQAISLICECPSFSSARHHVSPICRWSPCLLVLDANSGHPVPIIGRSSKVADLSLDLCHHDCIFGPCYVVQGQEQRYVSCS